MSVDFDWFLIRCEFPYMVDDIIPTNEVCVPFPISCYGRAEALRWLKANPKGIAINNEPFFDGKESTNTVMKKIDMQRIKVDGENYIDDFGFYVYFTITDEPGLKDLRY
jgi:hypothetical protein